MLDERANQFGALVGAFLVDDLVEGLKPFGDFFFVIRFRPDRKLDERVH